MTMLLRFSFFFSPASGSISSCQRAICCINSLVSALQRCQERDRRPPPTPPTLEKLQRATEKQSERSLSNSNS